MQTVKTKCHSLKTNKQILISHSVEAGKSTVTAPAFVFGEDIWFTDSCLFTVSSHGRRRLSLETLL